MKPNAAKPRICSRRQAACGAARAGGRTALRQEAPKGAFLGLTLEELIVAYLPLSGSVPGRRVTLERPESAPICTDRAHETGEQHVEPPELRAALWGQLDARAVAKLGQRLTRPREAPGINDFAFSTEEYQQRMVDVIRDHLTTMRSSYPISYAAAELAAADSILGYVAKVTETGDLPKDWIKPVTKSVMGEKLPGSAKANRRHADVTLTDPTSASRSSS